MRNTLYAMLMCAFACNCLAYPDLLDIYEQALANDTTFKEAYSTYMSDKETLPQAYASFLPSVDWTIEWLRYRYVSHNSSTPLLNFSTSFTEFDNSITLTQSVLDYSVWKQIQQAGHKVKKALANYDDASQDLIIRTAEAYFDVLKAEDTLRFAKAQLESNRVSLDQAQQRFKVGLTAITSVYEAKAAYDSSLSTVISSRNNIVNEYQSLMEITNHTYKQIAPLKFRYVPLSLPIPNDVDAWTHQAVNQNYSLKAAKFNRLATKDYIQVENAGHMPSVSFTANYDKVTVPSATQSFESSNTTYSYVGLTLTIPIYSGGEVESEVREAVYDDQTAQQEYEATYRETIADTYSTFNSIVDGISTIKADRRAVESAQQQLESTRAQFTVGTRTMADVVSAQKNLYEEQKQLSSDQYSYINNILKLKYYAGTLSPNDLFEINAWLRTSRPSGPAPRQPIHHK